MVREEPLSYTKLQEMVRQERKASYIEKLEADFYPQVMKFLERTREEYDRWQSQDPYAMETRSLGKEVSDIPLLYRQLYNIREEKVLKMARDMSRGIKHEIKNLTANEKGLLQELLTTLRHHREDTLSLGRNGNNGNGTGATADAAGEGEDWKSGPGEQDRSSANAGNVASGDVPDRKISSDTDNHGNGENGSITASDPLSDPSDEGRDQEPDTVDDSPDPGEAASAQSGIVEEDSLSVEPALVQVPGNFSGPPEGRMLVRILIDDLGVIKGTDDHEYNLKKEDLVELPEEMASMLIAREAALRVEPG